VIGGVCGSAGFGVGGVIGSFGMVVKCRNIYGLLLFD
jgi:hypothetical protein